MGHTDCQLAGVLQLVQAPAQLAQRGFGGGKVGLGLLEDVVEALPLETLPPFQQDSRSNQQGQQQQSSQGYPDRIREDRHAEPRNGPGRHREFPAGRRSACGGCSPFPG